MAYKKKGETDPKYEEFSFKDFEEKELKKQQEEKNEECSCDHEHCNCEHEHCSCEHEHCECENDDLATEYLNMARVIQADFDNYRKRSAESIRQAKIDGVISAVEVILPSLDVFKKAKDMIKDENSLKGIEMVENEIQNSLKTLGVEKIDTLNKQFDPNLHHALMVMEDNTKPDNVILSEYQAGYKMGDKVIKYSQVIVNKLKEDK